MCNNEVSSFWRSKQRIEFEYIVERGRHMFNLYYTRCYGVHTYWVSISKLRLNLICKYLFKSMNCRYVLKISWIMFKFRIENRRFRRSFANLLPLFSHAYNMPQAPYKKLRCESKKDCNQKIAMNINEMLIVASWFSWIKTRLFGLVDIYQQLEDKICHHGSR